MEIMGRGKGPPEAIPDEDIAAIQRVIEHGQRYELTVG